MPSRLELRLLALEEAIADLQVAVETLTAVVSSRLPGELESGRLKVKTAVIL